MSLTLSRAELHEFTGYKQPSRQARILKSRGIRFHLGADGHPRVLRSDLENKENRRRQTPDFSSLRPVG